MSLAIKATMFSLILTLVFSCLLAILVVVTGRWHTHLTSDFTQGIQKVHEDRVPRIGGLTILLACFIGALLLLWNNSIQSKLVWMTFVAALPAWGFGLAEDLYKCISTRARLLATMASGLLAWYLTGYALFRVDVPGVDWLLSIPFIAVMFTAFAIAGIANAINMIDGFNGLASGTVLICLAAFGVMAFQTGDQEVLLLICVTAAATLGFFLVNYPYGKLFLGDAGAYMLGMVLGWIAVLLTARHPGAISPWAPLLVCAYPILEALLSMYRRITRKRPMDQPDRTHLHSLVYRRVVPRIFRTDDKRVLNAMVAPMMWTLPLISAILAVPFKDNTLACALGFCIVLFLYVTVYKRLRGFRSALPKLGFGRRPPPANR